MKYIITIIALIILFLTSCSENVETHTWRAKVLENGTISYVISDNPVLQLYDTVWVNLDTRTIDDTSNNTMKSVLIKSSER